MYAIIRPGLIAAALLLATQTSVPAQSSAETAVAATSSVTILRGKSATPHITALPTAEVAPKEVVAGRRLWQHDPETGRVRVCEIIGTSTIGDRRIRCYQRRLPSS